MQAKKAPAKADERTAGEDDEEGYEEECLPIESSDIVYAEI